MTDVQDPAAAADLADQAWWLERFRVRYPEAGPPLLRRRSNVYRRKSRTVALPFSPELAERLEAAGGSRPERLHELFLAALGGVLYRYTGSEEAEGIVVGSPLPGEDARAEGLPLLVQVAPEAPFERLVEAAAASVAESYERADCSVEELIGALGMGEVRNRHPLFPVALRVAGYHGSLPELRNDLTATVSSGSLELEVNADVHDEASVERFGRHVLDFLARGLAEPGRPVRAVEYLSAVERSQLVEEWSVGPVEPLDERPVHELVEEAAARHPKREALVFGEQAISYGELDARANRLANHLRGLGVGRGSKVGLCLPATPELLVATLGILKSGAAAVPLVPTFPASRNAMAVEDSAMEVAVTESSLAGHFPEGGPELVCVDLRADEIARAPSTSPRAGVRPDDLVYVLFTSGSTGRPKGVAMEHRTLANLVHWQRGRGADPAGRRTLQRSSIGFDVSFQEIFSTWPFGGTLVMASDEVRDDVSQLPGFVERHGIARIFLPPVALDQVAVTAGIQRHSLSTLEEVVVSGEQLLVSMPMRRLFHELGCSLDNQYGPSETHVVTAHLLERPSTRWPAAPPIGRPIRNTRVYVLDPWLQPVPAGVPGEIYVGGVAPARGYLDPEQTAERFLVDPFAADPDARMYRSGDRARFLEDGTIESLGRTDGQVKIRGYRIELGEIEANLLRVPGVRSAAVAVHEWEALGKQLAAYVVTEGNGEPDASGIRDLLLDRLPGHMVPAPSSIVFLDALPTTPTGKVDRRALPRPARAAAPASAGARGDTEQTVAEVWARALGVERVGRDDNFLELGGHSLVGIQIVAQLNELYSVALPLRRLLQGTTVAALSADIDRLRGAADGSAEAAVEAPELQELELPDGRRVLCLHRAETEYLYLDVFGRRTYDRGGIRYPERGCVFDVGAHVGLFTLYALERSPGLEVVAFEPCPPLYEALRRNTEGLAGVRPLPVALADRRDTAELTFYPSLTGMSSFHPDAHEERALLAQIMRNLSRLDEGEASERLAGSEAYLDERLRATTFTCERRTLSDVLAETGIERIDLLKVDVQKAELEVLEGIAPGDWERIEQLVVELHDLDGRLERVTALLADRGYRVTVEQDALHEGTVVKFVYAV